MSFTDLFQQLNELDEHPQVEAKTASQLGDSLLETVCAFANEPGLGGGHILAGVEEADDTLFPAGYRVVGVADPDKLQSDIASRCATAFNRPVRPQIKIESADGERVVVVFVPEAQPSEKPIFFKNKGLPGGAWRRIGSTDQRCTDDDLLVFYQGRQTTTFDEHVVADADQSAIDPDAVAVYRRMREKANPNAEELNWSDPDLLKALCCATEQDGKLRPTAAGILLFGTKMAVRRYFPMMRIDYIRVPGREWVSDPDNRFATVELLGPLFNTLPRAFAAIYDDLPKSFNLPAGQLNREDVPLIPDRVIREAVVNAVMHRTYRTHGPVQIIRYENRLEIRNPGHSLKSPERFGEPGSQTRNPKIAAVLHDTDFAENKGSGIRVMREKMEAANLSPPYLESDRVGDQFIAILLFHHFVSEDDLAWVAHFPEAGFTDQDVRALVFLREAGAINNAAYRDLNKGCDTLTASGRLRRLRDLGLLTMKGKSTATYYLPTERLLAPLRELQKRPGNLTTAPAGTAKKNDAKPSAETVSGSPSSPGNLASSPGNLASSPGNLAGLPKRLQDRVQAVRGQATPADEVRKVILELCSWREMSAAEVAAFLGRSRKYVQGIYLIPMADSGELDRKFPEAKTHPQQAYRAAKKGGQA